jgi:hypothetical protein
MKDTPTRLASVGSQVANNYQHNSKRSVSKDSHLGIFGNEIVWEIPISVIAAQRGDLDSGDHHNG